MDRTENIHKKKERIVAAYPEEQERIEKCNNIIFEQDNGWLYQAYEKQLDRILSASNPVKARKEIAQMEHILTKSTIMSSLVGEQGSANKKRIWVIGMLVVIAIIVLTGIELLIKSRVL